MSNDTLLKELDFILTHPSVNVFNLENFYNNCLYIYDTVPLIVIVNYLYSKNPRLLIEWAKVNKAVDTATHDLDVKTNINDIKDNEVLTIDIAFNKVGRKFGYYTFIWESTLEEGCFKDRMKRRTLKVKSAILGELNLIGYVKSGISQFTLYLK